MPQQASASTQTAGTVNPGETSSWGFLKPMEECRAFSIVATGLVSVRVNSQDRSNVAALVSPHVVRVIELDPDIELRSIHVSNQTDGPVNFTIMLDLPLNKGTES